MPAEFEALNIGLIGCGGMDIVTRWRSPRCMISAASRSRIVAICDADATRRSRIAALLESRCGLRPEEFAEAPALLTHPGVEAVQIVLPTSLHHKMVLAALEAGKHVLVEKPMALTVAACDQIVMAAQQGDRVVAVAENYRRIPANRAMGALIRSGSLGPSEAMFVRNFASARSARQTR